MELDELYGLEGENYEWREKARWIKFEEDVEEGAERWGKPHVASLSFHSLLELRRCLENGKGEGHPTPGGLPTTPRGFPFPSHFMSLEALVTSNCKIDHIRLNDIT